MALPKAAKEELGFVGDQMIEPIEEKEEKVLSDDEDQAAHDAAQQRKVDNKMFYQIYKEGRYHLIPSFLRTLMYLKQENRDFAVAFRTFG